VFVLAVLGVCLVVVSLLDTPLVSAVAPAHWALLVFTVIAGTAVHEVVDAVRRRVER
jgi:hypothetical protein